VRAGLGGARGRQRAGGAGRAGGLQGLANQQRVETGQGRRPRLAPSPRGMRPPGGANEGVKGRLDELGVLLNHARHVAPPAGHVPLYPPRQPHVVVSVHVHLRRAGGGQVGGVGVGGQQGGTWASTIASEQRITPCRARHQGWPGIAPVGQPPAPRLEGGPALHRCPGGLAGGASGQLQHQGPAGPLGPHHRCTPRSSAAPGAAPKITGGGGSGGNSPQPPSP
jgi:hypothetical protein